MLDGAAVLSGSRGKATVLSYEQDGAAVRELTLGEDLAWYQSHHVREQATGPAEQPQTLIVRSPGCGPPVSAAAQTFCWLPAPLLMRRRWGSPGLQHQQEGFWPKETIGRTRGGVQPERVHCQAGTA